MAFKVYFKPSFVRQLNKLPKDLQEEVIAKIELIKNPKNHALLKVHKLHGNLKEFLSFSVDFKNRIVFEFLSKDEIVLLSVGDHNIYN